MENIKDSIFRFLKIDNLVDNLTGYVETRAKLLKIEIREDIASTLSKSLVYVALSLFGILFLLFFSIGLANYLNTLFADEFTGYWIVSGTYLLIFLLLFLFRKPIGQHFLKYFGNVVNRKEMD